jgi:hypothetical protein
MALAPGTRGGALFSPDCRYALSSSQLGPVCVQKFVDDPAVPGRRYFTAYDPKKPQPPHTLYDLSTGKRCGEYPGIMPLSLEGRLSPGGEYCVTRAWEQMPDLTKTKSFWLDVWKQGEPTVTGQIAPTGCVLWAEFISATHLAVFQQEPDPALVVWDVAARKVETRNRRPQNRQATDPNRSLCTQPGRRRHGARWALRCDRRVHGGHGL